MKNSRFQWEYREGASKLHMAVGNCLRTSVAFKHHEIYQEYPVNRVNTSYKDSSHHFDWVIPKLRIVIECHGRQHYTPVAFDGNYDNAVDQFQALKGRDAAKKEAALDAGYCYVEIPYSKLRKINEQLILDKIEVANQELEQYNEDHAEERRIIEEEKERELVEILVEEKKAEAKVKRQEFLASEKHKRDLKIARSYRRRRYKKLKELKKNG